MVYSLVTAVVIQGMHWLSEVSEAAAVSTLSVDNPSVLTGVLLTSSSSCVASTTRGA